MVGMKMFLGDFGDAINDSQAGGAIRRNFNLVAQAAGVAQQQCGQAQHLHAHVAGEVAQLMAQVGQIDQHVMVAEQSLFASLRR